MRIVYFYNEDWEPEYIQARLPDDSFNFIKGTTSECGEVSDNEAVVLSVFMNSPINAATLDRFPATKLVVTRSTGFDHIDLRACEARGITVANVPTYGEHTVAEFAMALLLSLSRKITEAHRYRESPTTVSAVDVRGFDLRGKTIGIVGTGHIGAYMIKMARGFSMNVIAYDVKKNDELAAKEQFEYVSLEDLLAKSDVISLHAPDNEHTHHMIHSGNIRLIKRGCYLINTARGGLIETTALVTALKEGIIAGAGLDVLEEEGDFFHEESLLLSGHPSQEKLATLLSDHYLARHPRVIVTAHIAYNTREAIERILETTVENVEAFRAGAPIHTVST